VHDHAGSIGVRDGDEPRRQPSDNAAFDPLANGLTLVRPRVLMCDHDWDTKSAAKHRAPDVRAERVRVHDVDSVAPKQRREAAHPRQIPSRPPTQRHVRDACGVERLDEWSWNHGPRGADGDREPLARQVRREADEENFGAAPGALDAIDQEEEAQSLRCGGHR
jgi:hypothetical protein